MPETLSFSLSQEKRGVVKKRETQNDSLECQYIYSKSLGSGVLFLRDATKKYFIHAIYQ
jgi:hypothetical protein